MLSAGFSIPVYNEPMVLERCLKSLRQQDYFVKEIVIIDDSSNDDSAKEQEKIARFFNAWYVYANYGPKRFRKCQAFNIGEAILSADIIFYSQADIWYPPEYVKKAMALHDIFDNIVIYPNLYHVNDWNIVYSEEYSRFPDIGVNFFKDIKVKFSSINNHEFVDPEGVGCACMLSIPKNIGAHWDSRQSSSGSHESDMYRTILSKNGYPVLVNDLIAYHIHVGHKDQSFFDIGWMESNLAHLSRQEELCKDYKPSLIIRDSL